MEGGMEGGREGGMEGGREGGMEEGGLSFLIYSLLEANNLPRMSMSQIQCTLLGYTSLLIRTELTLVLVQEIQLSAPNCFSLGSVGI